MAKRSWRWCLVGAACALVGVVSCGDDDGSTPSPEQVAGQGVAGRGEAGAPGDSGGAPSTVGGAGSTHAGMPSLGGAGNGGEAVGGSAGQPGEAGAPSSGPAFLYASTLLGGIQHASVDPKSGKLSSLSTSPLAAGHLYNLAANARFLFTAENDQKRVNVYPIADDGTLPDDPTSSIDLAGEPVSIALDPSGHFAFVATSSDEAIHILDVDQTTGALSASLKPLELAGPPAVVAVDPQGQHVYVTRMAAPGILGFALDAATGKLTALEGSPYGTDVVIAGALVFSPNRPFLFASGSGVSSFHVEENGALSTVKGSPFFEDVAADYFATNLAIDGSGRFLYASAYLTTNLITGFAIDPDAGDLTLLPFEPTAIPAPYSIAVEPSGRFLYASSDFEGIYGYAIDAKTGELTELESSPLDVTGLQRQMAFVTH